ncbi:MULTISPECIES: hypothetical protein [unclassified Leisingera]|uniref:hypothetical protein n=1 Tax=unclassified Leisingera TaxID=2614906 RepID=UPI0010113987|nr:MULTISPECIES: hypothetical protein [unclassified Leisingera]MCF6431725.1 hypothetical protein [Leisingera sp. MMG026]QAX30259.1 hypothetical protein ETW24_13275 [Leisingera sp. NJS204]
MLWKDCLRITGLGAAIALGLLAHGVQRHSTPQADSWAGQIDGIKPVQVETVTLPDPEAFNA